MTEQSALTELKGIGPKTAEQLGIMGIRNIGEFVMHFPVDYRDLSDVSLLAEGVFGKAQMYRLKITGQPFFVRRDRQHGMFSVTAADESGGVRLMFFNQPYLAQKLKKDKEFCFYGKLGVYNGQRKMDNHKVYEPEEGQGIEPVYALGGNLKQKLIRTAMKQALEELDFSEELSEAFRKRFGVLHTREELLGLHLPKTLEERDNAYVSRKYRQLLEFSAMLEALDRGKAEPISGAKSKIEEFCGKLPFSPTSAQRRAMEEIAEDLSKPVAMNRLVQGDVGSGKTAVAFAAAYAVGSTGKLTLMMAPTELLAIQHYQNARKIFGECAALLTGSTRQSERRELEERLKNGEITLLIGTHALLYREKLSIEPSLVITDEQHRFGVAQRAALSGGSGVHMLIMSATPIPRTLALVLYGKASVSVIDEYPAGRKPVRTYVVGEKKREDMYRWLKEQINGGAQAYVVCPLIETADELELRSVCEVFAEVVVRLKGVSAAMLHGRMKPQEKDGIMRKFQQGTIQVLVSTTVIEVGVDVPNAAIMIVENAERFGLAQLHQLRGRVGRGERESFCYFVTEDVRNPRLRILAETADGFVIAEKDLSLRGTGEMLGRRQHGEAQFIHADGEGDFRLLQKAMEDLPVIKVDFPCEYAMIKKKAEARSAEQEIVLN